MDNNKRKNRNFWIVLILLVLAGLFVFLGPVIQEQITFEEGWEPYGESTNQITGLERDINEEIKEGCNNGDFCEKWIVDDSKYWTLKRHYWERDGYGSHESDYSGDDFGIKAKGAKTEADEVRLISKNDFTEREFRATIILNADGGGRCTGGRASFNLPQFNYGEGISIDRCGSERKEYNIRTEPSPINDKITLYVNGREETTIEENNFKVKINTKSSKSYSGNGGGSVTIKKPAWREQFSCSKRADEQYYLKVFEEGDVMDKSDFPNWNKFCLDNPITIYTPSGSTTTKEPMVGMVEEDKSYTIPPGQIWTVEYIGELQDPETECESGEVYDLENEKCIARTQITFDFLEGDDKTVETDPIVYNKTDIKTHQKLEEDQEFAFSHIVDDGENLEESFNIGNDKFTSEFERISNTTGRFKFNYKGDSYSLEENNKVSLSPWLDVRINELKQDDDVFEYKDAKIEYILTLDTLFLETTAEKDKVTVSNSYKDIEGGITLTKTDELDTTSVENIDKTLERGETTFELDQEYRQVSARPYITIDTPEYKYNLDASLGDTTNPTIIDEAEKQYKRNPILGIIVITVFLVIVFLLLRIIIKNTK